MEQRVKRIGHSVKRRGRKAWHKKAYAFLFLTLCSKLYAFYLHQALCAYLRVLWKLVIWRHKRSSRSKSLSKDPLIIKSLFFSNIKILAFSNVDLRARFRYCLNSFLEEDPEPSAILFDIDIPDPLSCSANRNSFFCSRLSAISKSSLASSIADCHIFKS